MKQLIQTLAAEFHCQTRHVEQVICLLDAGNTLPFIARYRKEAHGSMDDQKLRALAERLAYLRRMQARRAEIRAALEGQGKWTKSVAAALEAAVSLSELEEVYRPFKQKRRTRASVAREKGLEPLALRLFHPVRDCASPALEAEGYVHPELGVPDVQAALAGAADIVAEQIAEDVAVRADLRSLLQREGVLISQITKDAPEDTVYSQYAAAQIPLARAQSHQILAINRGEREGVLRVRVAVDRQAAMQRIRRRVVTPGSASMQFVIAAAEDAWDRLLQPSMEREARAGLTERANAAALRAFGQNLKALLMQPPVRGCVTMGLDPGYRNGCKVAVVDATGKVLDTAVVYLTRREAERETAMVRLRALIEQHGVKRIAIGNGTASRETEMAVAQLLHELPGVQYMVVNEAGASVYSASPIAAGELPELDVNLRSAVSIARRMLDPLAELVKIDPKAIGVGQYQHDMPQAQLDVVLAGVVEDCVNAVGADLNTASAQLLGHIAGLNATIARNIVCYREENGPFLSRHALLQVPRLGEKTYEQCAGFLRVPGSAQLLDRTGVHPESYAAAQRLLQLAGYSLDDAAAGKVGALPQRVAEFGQERAAAYCGVGLPTLQDLVAELIKPGRDPRDALPQPQLRTDVMTLEDIRPGMELTGTVHNVVDFGVFVDVGVHQDGLVHISQLSDRYVRHPSDILAVGDIITVRVLEVDEKKKRISLTMRSPGEKERSKNGHAS